MSPAVNSKRNLNSIAIGCLLLVIGACSSSSTTSETVVPGEKRTISGESRFGCANSESTKKLIDYIAQKDEEAFKSKLETGIATGECTFFQAGETVFIVDVNVFSGIVKVRREGETAEFWTYNEAVK